MGREARALVGSMVPWISSGSMNRNTLHGLFSARASGPHIIPGFLDFRTKSRRMAGSHGSLALSPPTRR